MSENFKTEIEVMKNEIGNLGKNFSDFKKDYEQDMKEIKDSLKSLDNKFANKWVEWFAKIVIGGMVTALFGLIIYMINIKV